MSEAELNEGESRGARAGSKNLEHLARLLTLSYEPMFAWRLDGSIEFWNAGAERLYGFSSEEAIGKTSHALLQTRFPIDFSTVRLRLRNERVWSGELRHVCKDGHEVIVDCRMQLLDDGTVLEVNRDVTTVAVFRAVFDQSGIFAGVMDLHGYLKEINDLSLRWCGYTKEQVLNRPFWDTPWWRGSEEMKARIRLATREAAAGNVFREELRYWLADESERIVDFAMHPIRDQSGVVAFLHPTGIDITERKQIEAALHKGEHQSRLLASIVECSDDAIVSKNLDGIIASWNKGAERIFGYTAEEAIGQPISIVIPADRQNEEREILTRIRRGDRIDHFETIRQSKEGDLITVSLSVSPIKGSDGKIVGASKIARDITQQKRSQELISILAREAEHRSKNLLATVQASVRLSQSDTPEGLKKVIGGRIQALANVNSTLSKARWIGADLSTIATQELAPYAEGGQHRVRIDGPPILLEPSVAQAIAVIFHELATNAAKYGALSVAKGHVSLNWSDNVGGQLRLRWTETGGPKVQEPTRKGFGGRIIEQMIRQHSGKENFEWRAEGLVCEMTIQI
jgi:PAS domain S-box-containing protein